MNVMSNRVSDKPHDMHIQYIHQEITVIYESSLLKVSNFNGLSYIK